MADGQTWIYSLPPHLKEYLRLMRESPEDRELIQHLEVPSLPLWSPHSDLHEWAYASGKRSGYALALSHLGLDLKEKT